MKILQKITGVNKTMFAFVAIMFIASCSKIEMSGKDRVAAIVGQMQDPFFAATFTPKVLMEKSGMNDGALPFTYAAFASFFTSEESTGIDNDKQVQMVVANSGGTIPNVYAFIPLKSATKFKLLVEKELGASVQEKDGAFYFRKDEDNYVVAWKDELAIISNIPFSFDDLFSKGGNKSKEAAIALVMMLNTVSPETIHTEFRTFFDKAGDMLLYANGTSAYEIVKGTNFLSKKDKAELKKLMQDTKFESALNFENGAISIDGAFALADSLASYFEVLKPNGVDNSLLANGLSADPLMALSINISIPKMVSLMKANKQFLGTDQLDKELMKRRVSLDLLEDLLTGEMLLMIDSIPPTMKFDPSVDMTMADINNQEPIFGAVFGLKNSAKMTEMLKIEASHPDSLDKIGDYYYAINDQFLFLTNSELWRSNFENGQTKAINNSNGNLVNSAFAVHMSSKMAQKMGIADLEVLNQEMTDFMAKMSKDGLNITIKMKDATKNALRTILERSVEMYENQEKSNNSQIQDILNDEVLEEVESAIDDVINSDEVKNLLEGIL